MPRLAIRRKESTQGITCGTDSCGAQTRAMIRQITSYALAEGAALALMTGRVSVEGRKERNNICIDDRIERKEGERKVPVFVNICVFLIRE